jgi:transposase
MRLALMTGNKIESSLKFLNSGMSPRDLAKNLGECTPTIYRWISVTENP